MSLSKNSNLATACLRVVCIARAGEYTERNRRLYSITFHVLVFRVLLTAPVDGDDDDDFDNEM